MYDERTNEIFAMVSMYRAKVENFFIKRFGGEVIETEETSCYFIKRNVIAINPKDREKEDRYEHVKWHELGHAIWHLTHAPLINELLEEVLVSFPCSNITSMNDIVDTLDFLSLEYKTGIYGIVPLSDLIGSLVGKKIPHYMSHPTEYVQRYGKTLSSQSSEFCANVVSVIMTKNYNGIRLLQDMMPRSFNRVLDAVDKAMTLDIVEAE